MCVWEKKLESECAKCDTPLKSLSECWGHLCLRYMLLKSKTCLPRSQPDSDIDSYLRDAFCFDCECGFAQAHCGHHKTHSWVGITQYLDQACMVIPNDATGALYDAFDGIQLMLWAAIWCHSTEGKHPGVLSARGG